MKLLPHAPYAVPLAAIAILFGFAANSDTVVAVSPVVATITFGQTLNLTAIVTGKQGGKGVTWTATAGTIAGTLTTATFTPPQGCGLAIITATSKATPSARATATIKVIQVAPLTVSPPLSTIHPGESVKLTASGGCPAKF